MPRCTFEHGRAGSERGHLYVTLEPCNHTVAPPCTERIIAEGVRRVVVGWRSRTPRFGPGIERLRQAGIEVITGVLEDEARKLNEAHVHHRLHGRPFVTMKPPPRWTERSPRARETTGG